MCCAICAAIITIEAVTSRNWVAACTTYKISELLSRIRVPPSSAAQVDIRRLIGGDSGATDLAAVQERLDLPEYSKVLASLRDVSFHSAAEVFATVARRIGSQSVFSGRRNQG